ncbi:MAG: hypothetical protein J0H63_02715, partial [Rhizobiales bacterium]|nr:hypothetical protein [Hyphomicrobiales bacterium]
MIEADLSAAAVNGWPKEVHRVFGALDLRIVENPVPAERWAKIRTVIADELAAETRELTCLAAVDPAILPVLVHDWDEMIVKLGTTLVAAGIPRPEILAALGNADANALWKPAAADALPALRKSCMDDQAWSDRLATFRSLALGSSVERILAGENP